MSDQPTVPKKVRHCEADPPGTLEAKIEALRATFDKALPLFSELEENLPELPQLVREAVREELQSARKQPDGGPLLSKQEVADWLGVSPRTVDTLAADGELKKIYVGGSVRFSPGAVKAYIRRQAAGEGAA